jgi:MinD-like ATPase involved in chromosome partitioning or flagellar assembly
VSLPARTGARTGTDLSAPVWERREPRSAVVAMPRRGRLMVPADFLPETADPPELGWRRAAWRAGVKRLGPGARERRHREWVRLARRPLLSPQVIAVVSPKGGVGKSTVTALLGGALAQVRASLVAALDANPDSGNLVTRLHGQPSPHGAQDLQRAAAGVDRYSDLGPYLTTSNSGLCMVRGDPDCDTRLGPGGYRDLLALLQRFFSIIVVDLGTGLRDPAFQAVIEAADAVVAVTGPGFDAVEVLVEGLDWLSRRHPDVLRSATAVINGTGPHGLDVDQMSQTLTDWTAHVIRVPGDRHLAEGGAIEWDRLGARAQDAALELAGTVIDGLPGGPGPGGPGPGGRTGGRTGEKTGERGED